MDVRQWIIRAGLVLKRLQEPEKGQCDTTGSSDLSRLDGKRDARGDRSSGTRTQETMIKWR